MSLSPKLENWAKLGCREDFCIWKTLASGGPGLWGSLGLGPKSATY